MIGKYYQQMRFNTVPIASSLLDEKSVQNYIFAKVGKDQAMIDAYYSLEKIVARNSYLNSVYLYSEKYGYFSSLLGSEGFDTLSDPTLESFLKQRPKNSTLYQRNVPQVKGANSYLFKGDNVEPLNLFTICNNSYDEYGTLKYGIIVNLDESKARDLFSSDIEGTMANFYMFKKDGNFISHPNSEYYGKAIEGFPLFKTINNQFSTSGTMKITNPDGIEYLACWLTQSEMNWRLVYLLPMKEIVTPINTLRNQLVIIFFIICFLAILTIYLTSRRMEKSLSRKARLISYIKGNIDQSSFVTYHPQTIFSIAVIQINPESYKNLDSDLISIANEESNYIEEYFKKNRMNGSLLILQQHIYMYLVKGECDNLSSILKKLQIDIEDDLKIELNSIYIDGVTTFEELPEAANNLITTAKTVGLSSNYFTLSYKELKRNEEKGLVLFNTSNLEKALIMKDTKIYDLEVKAIIAGLKAQNDWELFKSLKIYLYYAFESTCSKYLKINATSILEDWKKELICSSNYDALEQSLMKIDKIIEQSNNDESVKRQSELIEMIKKFVDKNLFDLNLSSAMIADELNLSVGYVRSQFKYVENESINDYIGLGRLEKACNLLITTNKCINLIREEVGFSNYSYFCTYFKKMKNCSPSNYRKQIIESKL
jgi:AraC-like DNA-binding protein